MAIYTYTTTADFTGKYVQVFDRAFSSSEKITVRSVLGADEKQIELYARTQTTSAGLIFGGTLANFPNDVGDVEMLAGIVETTIGAQSFDGQASPNASWFRFATALKIGEGYVGAGASAFRRWVMAKKLTLPSSFLTADNYCFEGWSALEELDLGGGLTTVGNFCFQGASSLGALNLPATLGSVGTYSFDGLSAVRGTLRIPSALRSIGNYAFRGCGATALVMEDGLTTFGEGAFNAMQNVTSVTIANTLTAIPESGLRGLTSLPSLHIHGGITTIGSYGLAVNSALSSLTFGEGLLTLGQYALSSNVSLVNLTLPNSLQTINAYCFSGNTGLKNLTLGSGLTNLTGANIFQNCNALEVLTINATTPPTVSVSSGISAIPAGCVIRVPAGSVSAYKAASRWSAYASQIVAI